MRCRHVDDARGSGDAATCSAAVVVLLRAAVARRGGAGTAPAAGALRVLQPTSRGSSPRFASNSSRLVTGRPGSRVRRPSAISACCCTPTIVSTGPRRAMRKRAGWRPRAFEWAYYYGVALSRSGDIDRAVAALEKALALNPSDIAARLRLAELQLEQGRIDNSMQLYRALLRDRPSSALAHYGLGRALTERKDPTALEHYERAAALAPAFAAAHYALALGYARRGDRARARSAQAAYAATRRQPAPVEDPWAERLASRAIGPVRRSGSRPRAPRPRSARRCHRGPRAGRRGAARGFSRRTSTWSPPMGRWERPRKPRPRIAPRSPSVLNYPSCTTTSGFFGCRSTAPTKPSPPSSVRLRETRHTRTPTTILASSSHKAASALQAVEQFRAALSASPEHRDAHFNLAGLLLAQKDGNEAIDHFARATLIEDEKTSLYLYHLADAHARMGQPTTPSGMPSTARKRAVAHSQTALVERIDEDLRRLRAAKVRK